MAEFSHTTAGLEVEVPERCVCCMGEAGTSVALEVTRGDAEQAARMALGADGEAETVDFPWCEACRRHVEDEKRAWVWAVVPGTLVAAALLWLGGFPGRMSAGAIFLAVALGGAAIAGTRYLVLPSLASSGRSPACACSPVAVACMGPLAGGRYRFHFANLRYGREFAKRNP